jgi:hypothetical protein
MNAVSVLVLFAVGCTVGRNWDKIKDYFQEAIEKAKK